MKNEKKIKRLGQLIQEWDYNKNEAVDTAWWLQWVGSQLYQFGKEIEKKLKK